MDTFEVNAQNRIQRYPQRGHYDKATVYSILDAGLICHATYRHAGGLTTTPRLYARRGDTLLFHGSPQSGFMRAVAEGQEIICSVALADGLVVTKAVANLALNYRSVVLFGHGRLLHEADEKREALRAFTERLAPGHWQADNAPSPRALDAVAVAEIVIEQAAAKIRNGMPDDQPAYRDLPLWAGYLPLRLAAGEPQPAAYASPQARPFRAPAFLATETPPARSDD